VRPILSFAVLAMSLSLCSATGACAATLHLVGNFDQPIFVTSAPANPDDLFVVEREGRVVRVTDGVSSAFADLTDLVSCCAGERGLLSIALAPDFDASGRFHAAYTGKPSAGGAEGDIHVDAFRYDAGVRLHEPILTIGHDDNANHNGGQLQFGPDGYLYISTGDGGGAGDPLESGQSLDTLLGKILRIEPRPGAIPAIWSYGLRNPWRFSFDRESGDMVIADVGQGTWEEVDLALSPAPGVVGGSGANYGWNCREGFFAHSAPGASCIGAGGFTDPVFAYPHTDPEDGTAHGCSITGGYVARDSSLGDLYGRYVYADFCVGEIRSLILPSGVGGLASGDRSEGLSVSSPVSFGEDSCGRIYVVSKGGPVHRLEGSAPASCAATSVAPSASTGATTTSTGLAGTTRAPAGHRVQLHLKAQVHRLRRALKLVLTARVIPCADHAGGTVQLNRGGRHIARKRLSGRCVARFQLEVDRRSTFRALVPSAGASASIRSRRLVVSAG
jgi:hypothetical protein